MRSTKFILIAGMTLFVVVIFYGCTSSMSDTIRAKGTGEYRYYSVPFDTVWNATIETIQGSKLQLVTEDKTQGQILARTGVQMFASYGENVAIFISNDPAQNKTRIEVVSKKALSTTVFATNWATYIFEKLDAKWK